MYKHILLIFLLSSITTFGQTRYFNEFDIEISEQDFNKRNRLKVFNDSTKQAKIITSRVFSGEMDTKNFIDSLKIKLNINIDVNKPLVIVYHPGKDECNSGGTATPESSYNWHKMMAYGNKKVNNFQVIYVYKKKENIKTINKLNWNKDPKGLVENKFFHYHYPCSSYVILYNNKYISHYAEFSMNSVWDNIKKIKK